MGDRAKQSEGAQEFIQGLCEEYCDEAAALWEYRKKAVTAPDYDLNDLLELDKRLEAHIDALRVAGETGWEICRQGFEDDAGKCFVAAVLAFNSADEARAKIVFEKAAASPALKESVVSALHWLKYEKAEPHIRKMLESESTACRYIGIAASMLHRHKGKIPNGTRLLLGKPMTGEYIADVLNAGTQRQRAAAALEQAMIEPGKPLYEISAPAWRQLKGKNDPLPVRARPGCSSKELVITAVNCITPVGLNAEMTAASVRAGISRLILYDDYPDAEGNSIKAARINGVWDNEQDPSERLRKVAGACLEDMLEKYFEGVRNRPSQGYILLGSAPESRSGVAFGEECINTQRYILADYAYEPLIELVYGGNASFHRSIKRASEIIERNPESLCILGGIDSLIDYCTLNWFEGGNRLKSDSHGRHQGLTASEAVSFMIVERRDRASRDNRPILARIAGLGLKDEPQPRASGREGRSNGLSEACLAALESFTKRELRTIFGDLNGEASRAREWSIASLRCFRGDNNLDLWSPAEFYGDIGAASGGVLAGIATQGFARNWIESPVLIFCSDDHGQCGAVILENEGGSS